MKQLPRQRVIAFRRRIMRFYARHGRSLPFRKTTDPYKIAVAEIMLQQTQAERVLPAYAAWLRRWPTWRHLARAGARDLLHTWSGLGYNRRAIYLGKLAGEVVGRFGGRLPKDPAVLRTLPGIGPYTAVAILIFAFNKPLVAIDTNIRRVIIHEFKLSASISQSRLEYIARQLLPRGRSRDWHNALMDYSRLALPRRIRHLPPPTRQSPFPGSRRQIRGHIIRALTVARRVSIARVARELGQPPGAVLRAADSLQRDGLVRVGGKFISLV